MGVWELDALSVPVDGRVLEVVLAGPPDGMPLFVAPRDARRRGDVRSAGRDRRGARSAAHHLLASRDTAARDGTRAAPWPTALPTFVAVADALGYERFYSVGGSGGGPHSIACAALLPDRVIAAASIASPAPLDAEGFDWTAGMGQENVVELATAQSGDDEFEAYLDREADSMVGTSADEIVTVLGDVVSEVDRRALSGALGEFIVKEIGHALAPGVWGWFDDDRALFERLGVRAERASALRSPFGTAARTGSSRSRTASGWPRTSRRRGAPAPERRAPVAHRSVRMARSSTGCWLIDPSPSSPLDCAVRARNQGRPTGGFARR